MDEDGSIFEAPDLLVSEIVKLGAVAAADRGAGKLAFELSSRDYAELTRDEVASLVGALTAWLHENELHRLRTAAWDVCEAEGCNADNGVDEWAARLCEAVDGLRDALGPARQEPPTLRR